MEYRVPINTFRPYRIVLLINRTIYSASSLERPFLWFMVNDYLLCHKIVTITVIGMKSGLHVSLSFFSMLRSFAVV